MQLKGGLSWSQEASSGRDYRPSPGSGGGAFQVSIAGPGLQANRITEQTYYRWRKEYGGLGTDQAKWMKDLESENARLKKLVADLSLDKAILKEAHSENH